MASTARAAFLLAPPALLALGWLTLRQARDTGPEGARTAAAAAPSGEDLDPTLVDVGREAAAPEPPADVILETPEDEEARTEAAAPAAAEAPQPAATGLAPYVMGVVVDSDGRPLPGVTVKLTTTEGDLDEAQPKPSRGFGSLPQILYIGQVRTDRTGGFTFEGSDRRKGGTLVFGQGYLLQGELSQAVDPGAASQVLEIPGGPAHDSVWTITVTDELGRPVPQMNADLQFLGSARTALPHLPKDSERFVQSGLIEQRGLPPGKWRMSVQNDSSLTQTVDVDILAPRSEVESTLVLETFGGAYAQDVAPTSDAEGLPWIDPSSGLEDQLPEQRLRIGQDRRDRHFAQSLVVGAGKIRAAQLVLDLRGNSGMSSNDGIYLQHLGARKYAWSNRVAAVTGGRWENGMRRRVVLDLSRLPLKDGGTYNLLPELSSGRLDVVIQDDTAVLDLDLRVVR